MSQKSYDNNNKLYVIPTPIGNMDDITVRALNTLREVDVLFCEDTRVTGQLLKHFNISKKMISSHKFNEDNNASKLLEYLNKGCMVGVVSDRGTPIISDPGYALVKCAIDKGYGVVSLPGSTALIPALTSSGITPQPFMFYGFLNSKKSSRRKELEKLKFEESTLIFYEAPHRIVDTLNDMLDIFGNRKVSISREITKKYEEIYRGSITDVIKDMNNIKGELVIVIEGNTEKEDYSLLDIVSHVNLYIDNGYSMMDAIKQVAKDRNVKKSEIYDVYHAIGKKE